MKRCAELLPKLWEVPRPQKESLVLDRHWQEMDAKLEKEWDRIFGKKIAEGAFSQVLGKCRSPVKERNLRTSLRKDKYNLNCFSFYPSKILKIIYIYIYIYIYSEKERKKVKRFVS